MTGTEPKIYVLYENEEWMPPLRRALERAGLPYEQEVGLDIAGIEFFDPVRPRPRSL